MGSKTSGFFQGFQDLAQRFQGGTGRAALEDFDLSGLRALSGPEREEAIDLLIERLASGANDPRVPRALVAMGAERAAPALRAVLLRSIDETAVAAALALWEMSRDPAAPAALIKILSSSYLEVPRQIAAAALSALPGEAVEEALLRALDDEHGAVRGAALDALVSRHRLSALAGEPRSRLGLLGIRLRNPLRAVRAPAAAEARQIFGGAAEQAPGPEPAALGRFRKSVLDARAGKGGDLDLDALRALSGVDRTLGELLLLQLLADGDARAVRALAGLGDRRFAAVLREVAGGRPGKLATAAARVLSDWGEAG
jgi:hypothetical protein